MEITAQLITDEYNKISNQIKSDEPYKLYFYCSASATAEQIEANKLQLKNEWQGFEIELIRMPLFEKNNVVPIKIPMKQRGLNLLNKKW
jgi:hypothetical protein